jgi:hypothetical protein
MAAPPFFLQDPYLQGQGFYNAPQLSLGDLYQDPGQGPDFPAMPSHVDALGQLSEEDRKRIRRQAILQAALAFAAPHGRVGEALAGAAAGSQAAEQQALDSANRDADHTYQLSRQRFEDQRRLAADTAQQAQEKLAAQNRLSSYQKIVQMDPQLAAEAEGAARSGDDKRLQALLQAIPERQAERGMGYDPNDPFVKERVQAGLSAEADARKRKAVLEGLPEELKIKNQAELEMLPQKLAAQRESAVQERATLAARGLLWDPKSGRDPSTPRWEPKTHVVDGRLQMIDMNQIDPATGKPRMVDLGPVHNGGKPIYRTITNSMGQKETWVSEMDPETGQYGPLQPAPMKDTRPNGGAPPPSPPGPLSRAAAGAKSWLGSFLGTDKTAHPTPPAPKSSGAPAAPANPSPMVEQPGGAPVAGRGQGPATGKSPLRGKAAAAAPSPVSGTVDQAEAATRQIEQQTGQLPPQVRAVLKQRLAAGADPQQELQHLLAARPGGQ